MNDDFLNDLILSAATSTDPMTEIRVVTLSQFALEHHYPEASVVVQSQVFMDDDRLSVALDVDELDEFAHENVLLALLNLNEDVNLTRLERPCIIGGPVAMRWHSETQTYVRDTSHVAEHATF